MANKTPTLRADRVGEHRTQFEKNRQIILHTQHICGICGQEVDFSYKYPHPLSPTVDHIIPIAKGGHPSELANLQLAHRWCNRQKSDHLLGVGQAKENAEKKEAINNDDLPCYVDWGAYSG